MKKLLFILLLGTTLIITSCGKDECECHDDGATLTFDENDMKDAGMDDFGKYCNTLDGLAKINSATDECSIK